MFALNRLQYEMQQILQQIEQEKLKPVPNVNMVTFYNNLHGAKWSEYERLLCDPMNQWQMGHAVYMNSNTNHGYTTFENVQSMTPMSQMTPMHRAQSDYISTSRSCTSGIVFRYGSYQNTNMQSNHMNDQGKRWQNGWPNALNTLMCCDPTPSGYFQVPPNKIGRRPPEPTDSSCPSTDFPNLSNLPNLPNHNNQVNKPVVHINSPRDLHQSGHSQTDSPFTPPTVQSHLSRDAVGDAVTLHIDDSPLEQCPLTRFPSTESVQLTQLPNTEPNLQRASSKGSNISTVGKLISRESVLRLHSANGVQKIEKMQRSRSSSCCTPTSAVTTPSPICCDTLTHLEVPTRLQPMAMSFSSSLDTPQSSAPPIIPIDPEKYEFSKCHDIQCRSARDCQSIRNIATALVLYQQHQNGQNGSDNRQSADYLSEFVEQRYPNLINDFHHILNQHLDADSRKSNEEFEDIYYELKRYIHCDIKQCAYYRRSLRDREGDRFRVNRDEETVYMDIMDTVHCYLLHSYDLAFRIKARHQQKYIDHELQDEDTNPVIDTNDGEMRNLRQFQWQKRKSLRKILQNVISKRHHKFTTAEPKVEDCADGVERDDEGQHGEQKREERGSKSNLISDTVCFYN